MRRLLAGCFVLVLLGSASSLTAWGRDGHRIVGEIAWHELDPVAEAEVQALLEPGLYDNLAELGNWADAHARSYREFDWAVTRHYIPTDPEAGDVVMARDCPEGGDCIVAEIERLRELLTDQSIPVSKRAESLRFLVHFIQDIHQPLHVVHPDGEGGNRTRVTLFGGRETNLHSVWDSGLIRYRIAPYRGTTRNHRVKEAWKWWAWELRLAVTPEDRKDWTASLDPLVWAHEALKPSRELAFDITSGTALGEEYYNAAIPVVDLQLRKAGVRLAAVLNEIFADDQ
jgi:hypothetical protein